MSIFNFIKLNYISYIYVLKIFNFIKLNYFSFDQQALKIEMR